VTRNIARPGTPQYPEYFLYCSSGPPSSCWWLIYRWIGRTDSLLGLVRNPLREAISRDVGVAGVHFNCVGEFYRGWAMINNDPHVSVATKKEKRNEDHGSDKRQPKVLSSIVQKDIESQKIYPR
jgi:hypothetical protein